MSEVQNGRANFYVGQSWNLEHMLCFNILNLLGLVFLINLIKKCVSYLVDGVFNFILMFRFLSVIFFFHLWFMSVYCLVLGH